MKRCLRALAALAMIASIPSAVRAADLPAGGSLVKGSLPAVYYVTNDGKRLTFPNEATYFSWYQDFSQVQSISDEELASLPLSGLVTMRPGMGLIKTPVDSKVYAVGHGGVLCWIANEAMAQMIFGSDWSKKVSVLPEEFLTAYQTGVDITAGGQYWWRREMDASPTIEADRNSSLAPESLAAVKPVEVAPPDTAKAPTVAPAAEPTVKTQNVLYVLWDPQRPTDAAPDKAVFERMVFGSAPSLVDYYSQESDGRLNIVKAGVLGWYRADKDPGHYWSDDSTVHNNDGFTTGQAERLTEAVKKAGIDLDLSKYDANGDKTLSPSELSIFVVIPQSSADPTDEVVTTSGLTVDGMSIPTVSELHVGGVMGDKPEFGTLLHAFARLSLNLNDMSSGSFDQYSSQSFTLMGNHYSDLRLDPYNRIQLGWAAPTVIPKSMEVSDQAIDSSSPKRKIIRVDRDQPGGPSAGTEYFLIENRERGVYDDSLPDEGLAIWDINGSSPRLLHLDSTMPINDAKALWHSRGSDYAPTGLELRWASDNVRSGVQLQSVGAAASVMFFTLSKKILTELDLRTPDSPIK